MQNRRIALTGGYPPPFGGVSTSVLQLAELLTKDDYSIRVFASNPVPHNAPEYVSYCRLRSLDRSCNLLVEMRKFRPDLIHSHASTVDWRLGIVAQALRIPIVYHIHGERFPQQFALMSPIQRTLVKVAVRTSTGIIAVNSDLADFAATLGADRRRIYVVPSLLPLEEEHLSPDKSFPSSKFRLVTSGYFPFANSHYGFHLVPAVAKRLRENGIAFAWCLVGQANEAEIESYGRTLTGNGVQDHVIIMGELDRPHMLELLRNAHIYVRTKYSDSFGIVIAEAHQLGCHCLFGDNNPYFQEGSQLTTSHTGDIDSLAEKVLEIIPHVPLHKSQHVDSLFAAEAQKNYDSMKRIYAEIATK